MCTLCLHLNLNPQGALSFCPKTDTKNIRYIYDYNCLARIYFAGITTVVAVHNYPARFYHGQIVTVAAVQNTVI
jgi:hypothetical protein